MIEKIEMSDEQFNRYLEMRHKEIQMDSRKSAKGPSALNQDFSTYRVMSRLVCNYAVPSDLRGTTEETNEDTADDDKAAVLEKLRLEPDKYPPRGAENLIPENAEDAGEHQGNGECEPAHLLQLP